MLEIPRNRTNWHILVHIALSKKDSLLAEWNEDHQGLLNNFLLPAPLRTCRCLLFYQKRQRLKADIVSSMSTKMHHKFVDQPLASNLLCLQMHPGSNIFVLSQNILNNTLMILLQSLWSPRSFLSFSSHSGWVFSGFTSFDQEWVMSAFYDLIPKIGYSSNSISIGSIIFLRTHCWTFMFVAMQSLFRMDTFVCQPGNDPDHEVYCFVFCFCVEETRISEQRVVSSCFCCCCHKSQIIMLKRVACLGGGTTS